MTELMNALALIKEECEKHGSECGRCPLRTEKNLTLCSITDKFPAKWELKTDDEIKREIPRVFK